MKPLIQVFTYMIITLTVIICQKDSDEGRPYEFGFTIDGEQHRHEKKDENGIIQGEFGFITADGVYHVTVYATDENGNFKILSMRNIRISAPLDGSPATGPISPEAGKYLKKANLPGQQKMPPTPLPQKFERLQQLPAGPQAQNVITTQKPRAQYVFTTKPTIKPACAGCGYVTTAKPVPGQSTQSKSPVFAEPVGGFPLEPSVNTNFQLQNRFSQTQSLTPGQNQPYLHSENLSSDLTQNHQGIYQNSQQYTNFQQNTYSQHHSFQSNLSTSQGPDSYQDSQQLYANGQLQSGRPGFPPGSLQGGSLTPKIVQEPQNHQNSYRNPKQNVPQLNEFGQLQNEAPGFSSTGLQVKPQTQQGNQVYQNAQNSQSFGGFNKNQNSVVQSKYNQGPLQADAEILTNIPGIGAITNTGRLAHFNAPPSGSTRPNSLPSIPEPPKLPPVSVYDNVIHVGGKNPMDIPIKDKYPGMVDGLPNGVEEADVKNILYKFKYTVGFHGHYEKGLRNGTKIGGYFVNGRDGISRVVTYVADENGYRPKFKFINLGLDSPDTPKEDTEKTFGLKSFEFVWYPVE